MTEDSPDYQRGVQPGRVELITGQERSYYIDEEDIAATTILVITLGTVPAGEEWVPHHITISCTASGIQRTILVDDDDAIFITDYDIDKTINFLDGGIRPIAAGSVVKVWIYNLDSVERTFHYNLHYTVRTV